MELLIILWIAGFVCGLCPNCLIINSENPKGIKKILWAMVGASITSTIFGLPILGLISLFR